MPARSRGPRARSAAEAISCASTILPGPTWLRSAISPSTGPRIWTPRSRRTRTFSCVAGLRHMRSFIAGAASQSRGSMATSVAVTTSSARPVRSFASRSAVAGAITANSAQSASETCPAARIDGSPPPPSQRSVATGFPVSAWKVSGATNRCAAGVNAHRTSAPVLTRSRAASQALKAAIPPPTQRSTRTVAASPRNGASSTISGTFHRVPATRKAASPGISATHAARRIALYALYSGPVVFLLATAVLVVGLWKRWNSGGLLYLAVAALAGLGAAFGYVLQRRLRDISQALERAQRTSTVGLLTAGFAHEMKNALTVILGFAELARTAAERAHTEPKVTRHLKELENETRRTVAQLQSFLSYSSGEKVSRRPQDVNELVNDALQMVRPMARIKELQVDQTAGEPPRIDAD